MVETMTEEGTVVAIVGGECVVRLRPPDGQKCRQCGLCAAAADEAESRRVLRLPAMAGMEIGSAVQVEITQPNPAVAALSLFGIPAAGLGVGAAVGALLAGTVACPVWVGVAGGLCLGFLAATAVLRRLQRRLSAQGAFRARIIPYENGDVRY